jgi:molybdenum cofactor synthesis domain-containing protein
MDGFAVRSEPGAGGRSPSKVTLRLVGRSFPGDDLRRLPRVTKGTAVEILTGAALPPGADSIIRSEDCRRSGDKIRVRRAPIAGRDVARRGEDFRPGRTIAASGTPLRPWHIAAFLANEIPRVRVVSLPRVGVLSTGGELVAAGDPLRPGQVRDTTRPLVLALLAELGVPALDLGLVPDSNEAIRRAVRRGLTVCDILITTGGSSVGLSDLVPTAIRQAGRVRWVAARLRLRPGSTTGVAIVRNRPVFLLSGPPVAAFAGFMAIVEPFLRTWGGVPVPPGATVTATLDRRIPHSRGGRELARVRLVRSGRGHRASVTERHGAARLSSLTDASGILTLDEEHGDYRRGEVVQVLRL